jgi:hypothetical protein
MPATRRGIYHNLRESKYVVSNGDITFYFSSPFLMNKFMLGYKEYRNHYRKLDETPYNTDILSDIAFYNDTEKRGFFVRFKGAKINQDDLYKYALRKMTEKESFEWVMVNGKQKTKKKEQ